MINNATINNDGNDLTIFVPYVTVILKTAYIPEADSSTLEYDCQYLKMSDKGLGRGLVK